MEQVVIAVLSALAGIFGFIALSKFKDSKNTETFYNDIKKAQDKEAKILAEQIQKEKEIQGKIDEITKEQNKPITNSNLVDFFNNRKE